MTPIPNLAERLANCRGVLVDSNVLIDVLTKDKVWATWSAAALAAIAERTALILNPLVFAEASMGFSTVEALNAALPENLLQRAPLPWEAAFLAGKCFVQYRRRGGTRTSTLPDFYIGAHAALARLGLLTRDAARYRTYFPRLEIFAPER